MRYYMDFVRGIFLKGSGLEGLVAAGRRSGDLRRDHPLAKCPALQQAAGLELFTVVALYERRSFLESTKYRRS